MQVVVDSLLINYRRSGKGKTIVLLHGWGDSAKGLGALHDALAKNYEVITLDLPGFGGSESPAESWDLTDYAQNVSKFCDKLRIEPYALVGHSNGGAIAIRGVARNLLSPHKLVLLASAGIRGEYKGRMKALRLVTKAGKALTMPLPKTIKSKLRRKVYKGIGSDMLVAEHLQQTFKRVVNDDVRRDAAIIHVPTLLIYGEHDQATPPDWGRKLHQAIADSSFVLLPEAGHFVHVDQPGVVVRKVLEFLK